MYIQNLLDNYVSGYPVLICAALESFCIGWIYGKMIKNDLYFKFKKCIICYVKGIKRLKEDIKLMLGSYPNIYWVACFKLFTPIITIVIYI